VILKRSPNGLLVPTSVRLFRAELMQNALPYNTVLVQPPSNERPMTIDDASSPSTDSWEVERERVTV
jgi:hypothetical protein